jgi:hypothetical protein
VAYRVEVRSVVVAVGEFADVPMVHFRVVGNGLAEEIASFELTDSSSEVLSRDQMAVEVGPHAPGAFCGVGAVVPVVGAGQDDVRAAFEDGFIDCGVWEVGIVYRSKSHRCTSSGVSVLVDESIEDASV